MRSATLFALVFAPLLFLSTSCEKKGPAEKVGEELDDLINAVEDAADKKKPGA